MMTYQETLAWGASQYADVLQAIANAGHKGGTCAALIMYPEAGYDVLITDEEVTLSWARAEHAGWSWPVRRSRRAPGRRRADQRRADSGRRHPGADQNG